MDYFAALRDRRDEAVLLTAQDVRFREGSPAIRSDCHRNVDRWIGENPYCKAVRGWLVMSYGIERHSVVQTFTGDLIDMTLPDPYHFLHHNGSQADFDQLGENGCNQVFWTQISN